MPKASITAFYWWLIPIVFRNMRFLLWITTVYIFLAAIAAVLVDVLLCVPVHYNWSLNYDEQGQSIWNSWADFWVNWTLNFSADVILFFIPFFIIKSLKLRQRQKFGLIAVFSLGLITMAISFGRFMIYTVSNYDLGDNDGAVMCTAEMCTSLIVASLPGLKVLITRTVANHSSSRSTSGYNKSSEPHPPAPSSRIAKIATRISRPRDSVDDSEFELISVSAQNKEFGVASHISIFVSLYTDLAIFHSHDREASLVSPISEKPRPCRSLYPKIAIRVQGLNERDPIILHHRG
ncbi:hypothetical protein E4T42_08799 [Aureobasidium subglaciale]|nr:hypothetical protein E4T42_08799 [Aureobasidium subglaciale]